MSNVLIWSTLVCYLNCIQEKQKTPIMNYITYLFVFLLFPVLGASQAPESALEDALLQKWVFVEADAETMTYLSSDAFKEDALGIEFLEGGALVVQQNSGWCGTPPISYAHFSGTWKRNSSSELVLEHEFWGGTTLRTLTIVTLTKDKLILKTEEEQITRREF